MSGNEEHWRWVPGYEGLYMVSDMGNVMPVSGRRGSEPFKQLPILKDIGARYGVSDAMVSSIKKGKTWRSVTCR